MCSGWCAPLEEHFIIHYHRRIFRRCTIPISCCKSQLYRTRWHDVAPQRNFCTAVSVSACFACRERSSFCIFLASLSCAVKAAAAATVTFLAHKPRFASRGTRHTPIALSLCAPHHAIYCRASQLAGFSVTENAKQRAHTPPARFMRRGIITFMR
jgi:hypothetical protein